MEVGVTLCWHFKTHTRHGYAITKRIKLQDPYIAGLLNSEELPEAIKTLLAQATDSKYHTLSPSGLQPMVEVFNGLRPALAAVNNGPCDEAVVV